VHGDMNHDGIDDLVGITSGGYVYAYDVAHQVLIWSSTGLNGGRDIAVADLDGDGVPEIIALSNDQVIVYAKSGSTYLQRAAYGVAGISLLVADTNGDGKPEIYVLAGNGFGATSSTVYQFDHTLASLNSFTVPAASGLYLEQSAFARKNLVVATTGSALWPDTGSPSLLQVVDPSNGALVWMSPPLVGNVSLNSLGFYDLNGDGKLKIAFGTATGMYLTQ